MNGRALDYNSLIADLQDALLNQAISQAQYDGMKADLIHPSSGEEAEQYNAAIVRLLQALFKKQIDADTYGRLKGDLIRPGASAAAAACAAPAAASAPAAPAPAKPAEKAAAPPTAPSAPPASRRTVSAAPFQDLLDRYQEQGVLELIVQHPLVKDNLHLLERKIEELERKRDYSPVNLKTIDMFGELLAKIKSEKSA